MHLTDIASYLQAGKQEEEKGERKKGKRGSTVDSITTKSQTLYRLFESCSFVFVSVIAAVM